MVVEIPKWLYDALVERKGRRNPNANRLFGADDEQHPDGGVRRGQLLHQGLLVGRS